MKTSTCTPFKTTDEAAEFIERTIGVSLMDIHFALMSGSNCFMQYSLSSNNPYYRQQSEKLERLAVNVIARCA